MSLTLDPVSQFQRAASWGNGVFPLVFRPPNGISASGEVVQVSSASASPAFTWAWLAGPAGRLPNGSNGTGFPSNSRARSATLLNAGQPDRSAEGREPLAERFRTLTCVPGAGSTAAAVLWQCLGCGSAAGRGPAGPMSASTRHSGRRTPLALVHAFSRSTMTGGGCRSISASARTRCLISRRIPVT